MKTKISYLNNLKPLVRGRLPGQLIIQYTNLCNANCPQCGMRRSENFNRVTLEKDRVKAIIDTAADKGVRFLSFTGGEPLMFLDDIVELTNHAAKSGIPYIRTGTNGFIFRNSTNVDFTDKIARIADKLAATDLYTFWISIDSAIAKDHEKIRGLSGVIKGIEKALPIFHERGIYPSANLGINRAIGGTSNQPFLGHMSADTFRHVFETSFESFYSFVYDLGFTIANACYPMSCDDTQGETGAENGTEIEKLYGAASSDSIVNFTEKEKALIFEALYETIPRYRGKLRIFSPRCALYNLKSKYQKRQKPLFGCRGGTDFFFVECENGLVHPCGYRMEPQNALPDLSGRLKKIPDCDKCEWECFRDPSDIMGPFADFFTQPLQLIKKVVRDPQFFRLLYQDINYYKACGFFNGRRAPQFQKMRLFETL